MYCTDIVGVVEKDQRYHLSSCFCHRFTYEEEATPEDFFVPLVWSLVVSDSLIPWQHSAILLFTSHTVSRSYSEAEERFEANTPQGSRDGASVELARLSTHINGLDVI